MNRCRNRAQWVLEPESRATISQQIGGLLYDFIEQYPDFTLSDGKTKSLLSCIREETRMCDTTLKRVFRGESDSLNQQRRILCAIHEWVGTDEYQKLWHTMGVLLSVFFTNNSYQFLEEQVEANRPKRKAPLTP